MEGILNRRWGPILPVSGEIVGFPRGGTPVPRASPPDWPRAGGGGALGQWDWGSENAGMKVICLLYYKRKIGVLRAPSFFYWVAPSEDRGLCQRRWLNM